MEEMDFTALFAQYSGKGKRGPPPNHEICSLNLCKHTQYL